jgi:hypothetical protein
MEIVQQVSKYIIKYIFDLIYKKLSMKSRGRPVPYIGCMVPKGKVRVTMKELCFFYYYNYR